MGDDVVDDKQNVLNTDFLQFKSRQKNEIENEVNRQETIEKRNDLAPGPYADYYTMNHKRRGIAIIFNHVNFTIEGVSKREGSTKDRDDLIDIFHKLNFDVLPHDDLTSREVLSVLVTVSQMDHSEADCLVIVVMSHGDNGKIYAKDDDYPTKRLWAYFNARNCPTLAGKPKLFFIQACRGQGLHRGHVLEYAVSGTEEDGDLDDNAYYTIPQLADILIMYSTVEGYYSWRDPKNGSYFIQSLVNNLNLHYETKDLLTILTFVNREVAIDFTSRDPDHTKFSGCKQMCSIVSMLTRLVNFTDNYNY